MAPLVLAARRADARRDAAERFRAVLRACLDSCAFDATSRLSRFRARVAARERAVDVDRMRPLRPWLSARLAARRVRAEVVPFLGAGRSTPDLRAFESPMAMACFVERAPCLPSRMWSISSRTNSPACVDGARPARFAWRARLSVVLFGIRVTRRKFCAGLRRLVAVRPSGEDA